MARKPAENREKEITSSIRDLVDSCDQQVSLIKSRWRENYDMFVYGTQNSEKEEWQTNFSVNKLNTSTRAAAGRLVNILVNTPDWYELCPSGYANQQAELLAPTFKKMLDYYLDSAKFKRHAGTFFLCSLISQGAMYVGWKNRMVQNPAYLLEQTKTMFQEEQQRMAKNVVNPQVEPALNGADMEQKLLASIDEFVAEAQGLPAEKPQLPPYVQIGCLDLKDINHEKLFWDPNVMYMEDSVWKAFKYTVNRWELERDADLGYFSKQKVSRVGDNGDSSAKLNNDRLRYGNTIDAARSRTDIVELLVYTGPLIVDGKVEKDRYFCVIANDSIILKDGDYPFWEPPGHHTPITATAVRQIPYRATGAGIGDNAVMLQKIYDSNWQLVCDTFRFGIAGINVVNHSNLVDKTQLKEGIYPGMTLEVRGDPKENFQHVNLTSNLENQASPVQSMLEGAIDQLTGINELMVGGSNQFSRTAAAETNARLEAGNANVNTIALDLEQNFLIPVLEKCFARVLQFGFQELQSNPELQSLFSPDEMNELNQLAADSRFDVMNMWYRFKVKGFSYSNDQDAQLKRMNELLSIANGGGPLGQLMNLPEFMKEYFKAMGIKEPDRLLIVTQSPLQQVTAENQALMTGHMVMPAQNDDHQFHMEQQGALAQSPYATPEMQQHLQMHQQFMMMAEQAAQQDPNAPQQGQPPVQ
jgi:hypothetical protein